MGKKKGVYYEVLGKSGMQRYKLGYTSSKASATRYFMEGGWKKKDLIFRTLHMKKKEKR